MKFQNQKLCARDLSVSTAESLVAELAPIGMERPSARACFSHLPRARPGAEAGRPGFKSILIGAPIPYTERLPAIIHGGAAQGTVNAIVLTAALVPRTGVTDFF